MTEITLPEALEIIRQLREVLCPAKPLVEWRGLRFTRRERTILTILLRQPGGATNGQLEAALDIVSGNGNAVLKIVVHDLRRKMAICHPPVTIRNRWGVGYIIDPESAANLRNREVTRPAALPGKSLLKTRDCGSRSLTTLATHGDDNAEDAHDGSF